MAQGYRPWLLMPTERLRVDQIVRLDLMCDWSPAIASQVSKQPTYCRSQIETLAVSISTLEKASMTRGEESYG